MGLNYILWFTLFSFGTINKDNQDKGKRKDE